MLHHKILRVCYCVIGVLCVSCSTGTRVSTETIPAPTPNPTVSVVTESRRPNIVLIIADDQRFDTMEFMPRTQGLIFDQGVIFSRAYITTPLCCPSRSSILTGMYAHNHGVHINDDPLTKDTFVMALHESGYRTGLVGKYLNSYPDPITDPPRPEFDTWNTFVSGPQYALYLDPTFNLNGEVREMQGYQTFLLQDLALDFIRESAADRSKPFFLMFTPYAPHAPAMPAPGDETLYTDIALNRPPNFNEEDVSDKPAWEQALPLLDNDVIQEIDDRRLGQIQALNGLDQSVESIMQELESTGLLNNTFVLYLSDNGLFWGEHRLDGGKGQVYEEASRVPFAIRYPPLIAAPRIDSSLVANIDIAPTIYELAGLPIPNTVNGMSLVPLLRQQGEWRDALLVESWAEKHDAPPYQAIVTEQYVYVSTEGDTAELYDLNADPYELNSIVSDPEMADVIAELQAKLDELAAQ